MKHSDSQDSDPASFMPPPPYSPPGQSPPVQMQTTGGKEYTGASAPPPPPGIHAPGVTITHQPPPSSNNNNNNNHPHLQQPQSRHATPTIVYATSTTLNPSANQFGPYPMRVDCPLCNAHIMTETHSIPGLLTYVLSGALCFLVPYICGCLFPFCVRECKDIEHRCPSCQHKLGLFKRI